MKMFRSRDITWFCSVVFGLLVLQMFSSSAQAADRRYLWQSRDQFVAIERQENSTAVTVQPNDHPVTGVTLERLSAILESINTRSSDGDKVAPLLTRSAVQVLAPELLQGLQKATPGEDVTFAVIGLHDALYGLAKSPKVTTGRVFYTAGTLNIIVGLVQQEVRDRDDRRLFPFTPGSRQKALEGEWTLLLQPGANGSNQIRKDWVAFSDKWQAAVVQSPVSEQRLPAGQLSQPEKRSIDTRKPSERLTTLNELKDKGLISEEEYRGKRLDILNDL